MAVAALHLPLNGSLDGRAGSAPVTANGYGALRWRGSDLAGRSCALVEEAGTNYVPNPSFELSIDGWTRRVFGNLARTTDTALAGAAALAITDLAADEYGSAQTGSSGINVAGASGFTLSGFFRGDPGSSFYLWGTLGSTTLSATVEHPDETDGTWQRATRAGAINPADTTVNLSYVARVIGPGGADTTVMLDAAQAELSDHASSPIPELDASGNLLPGYAWSGPPHNSVSTRALTTIEAPYSGSIAHVFCRYSEDFGETWATASLTAAGTFGDYAVIAHAADVLTIESSRALLVRDVAVYDVSLTEGEQAAVMAAIEAGAFDSGLLQPKLGGLLRIGMGLGLAVSHAVLATDPIALLRGGGGE